MLLTSLLISPLTILAISKNVASSVDAIVFFASVSCILNLWAPGADSLDEPVALSFNELSSVGVTKLSVIVKPIL